MLDLSVVVPVRNAEYFIKECLDSIIRADPREIIIVDGNSTDQTFEIIQQYISDGHAIKVMSDDGAGVPAARMIGIKEATNDIIALVDVDIVFPEGTLEALYNEFTKDNYDGLQAGLRSESGPGYWGQALVYHHRQGRSKHWPGVMCTIFKKKIFNDYPFDERFRSGEDIELRWRLQNAGLKLSVSHQTIVRHRYGDTYDFAMDQWLQDGKGLGRMYAKYGWPAAKLLVIPLAGCVWGILLCIIRFQPKWIPYYLLYFVFNYWAMPGGMREKLS